MCEKKLQNKQKVNLENKLKFKSIFCLNYNFQQIFIKIFIKHEDLYVIFFSFLLNNLYFHNIWLKVFIISLDLLFHSQC